ncbi:ATP-binding protein [Streptomyces sp. SM12]|uniref:ATP-binding protein n=1 Tax=Streptomyces sp. SM12 TaxID=1071602 RepID=UPI001CA53C00
MRIAVAPNRPFTEWDRTFTDKRFCQAIVDRLTFETHVTGPGVRAGRRSRAAG